MSSGIEHERYRFSTMDKPKLRTRLSRITKSDKLLQFRQMAITFGYDDLADAASAKFARLYGYGVQKVDKFVATKIKSSRRAETKNDKSKSVRLIRF